MTRTELINLTNKIVTMVDEEAKLHGLDLDKDFSDVGEAMLIAMQIVVGMSTTANLVARLAPKPAPGY